MQRNRPIIFAAAILGLLAIGLTLWSMLNGASTKTPSPNQQANAAPAKPRGNQVVALHEIPPRTVITRDLVASTDGAPLDGIIGKLAADTIGAGQTVTPALLIAPIHRSSVANFPIPAGTRAVAVMIDPGQTTGNIVDVGDHVDVIIVHKLKYKTAGQEEGELRSGRTIAQNLLVLATDPALKTPVPPSAPATAPGQPGAPGAPAAPPAPTPTSAPPQPGQPVPKIRVILAAAPAEAERIAAAQEIGNINLTIRDPNAPDVVPVPEAIEYPIPGLGASLSPYRAAAAAGAANRNAGSAGSSSSSRTVSRRRTRSYSDSGSNLMPVPPVMPNIGLAPPPPPPADSEVTVIRGTEKTRVLVPQH